LSLFPWGKFRRRKSAVKRHTLLDLRGSIPTNVYVAGGQVHDVNILDQLLPEAGAFYLLDGGYVDYRRPTGLCPSDGVSGSNAVSPDGKAPAVLRPRASGFGEVLGSTFSRQSGLKVLGINASLGSRAENCSFALTFLEHPTPQTRERADRDFALVRPELRRTD
jgi:hypothetical protein